MLAHEVGKFVRRFVWLIQPRIVPRGLELGKEGIDAIELLQVFRIANEIQSVRRVTATTIHHNLGESIAARLVKAIRDFEFFLGAGKIRLARVRVNAAWCRTKAQPQNADEDVPFVRRKLIQEDLLRASHSRRDIFPRQQFQRHAGELRFRLVHRVNDTGDPFALVHHVARRSQEHPQLGCRDCFRHSHPRGFQI